MMTRPGHVSGLLLFVVSTIRAALSAGFPPGWRADDGDAKNLTFTNPAAGSGIDAVRGARTLMGPDPTKGFPV